MGAVLVRESRKVRSLRRECALWPEPPTFLSPPRKPSNSSESATHDPPLRRLHFALGSSCGVLSRTIPRTGKWRSNWIVTPTRCVNGGGVIRRAASMVWKTCRVLVPPGLFPPADRPRVVIFATEKPADKGIPTAQWSLSDLAAKILQEAPPAAM